MYLVRRILVGTASGLAAALLFWGAFGLLPAVSAVGLVRLAPSGLAGALIGASLALFFIPGKGPVIENMMSGCMVALAIWVALVLNLGPAMSSAEPMWDVSRAATQFPLLVLYLFLGALSGVFYGWLYGSLSHREAFTRPALPTDPERRVRVVIIGGGYAGVSAAQALDRQFIDDESVEIYLLSQTNYLLHTPMLSEVSASAVNPQNISPPLRNFFRRVQVIQCQVDRIDLQNQQIHVAATSRAPGRRIAYDHVILALGSVPNFFGNQQIERQAFTFKSLQDAMRVRSRIIEMFEQADAEGDPQVRQAMLTFVVAGGGFAGVELIGGINDFARGILGYYPNIPAGELRLILVHSRDAILQELSPQLGSFARWKLETRGVEFLLGSRVTGAGPGMVAVGDQEIPTRTFVWTAGNKPSPVLEQLGLPLTGRGQVEVNAELSVPQLPGIWAVGDCAQIPDLTTGKFCPPTAQHAVRQGKVAGHNVAAAIRGKALKTFRFRTIGQLAALGHQLAVAEVMGHRFSGFLAWLLWRSIYLSKLPTFEKQVRVGLDWLLDIFFPADIVQTLDFNTPPSGHSVAGSTEDS